MRLRCIPGYKELISNEDIRYEDILAKTPSDLVIELLASINNELDFGEEVVVRHERILNNVIARFSKRTQDTIRQGILFFEKKMGQKNSLIFEREYLLKMILRELERDSTNCSFDFSHPIHEFNFFYAYLKFIDDISDYGIQDDFSEKTSRQLFNMFWVTIIGQYEYNESADISFEFFRLDLLIEYAEMYLKEFWLEFLSHYGFKTANEYKEFWRFLFFYAFQYKPQDRVRRIVAVPFIEKYQKAIGRLIINNKKKIKNLTVDDIKKFPLFQLPEGYCKVLDLKFLIKKMFTGTLFELFYSTKLKDVKISDIIPNSVKSEIIKFDNYKSFFSKIVMEQKGFKRTLAGLSRNKRDVLHFDDEIEDGFPDMYFRGSRNVFFIEFKDYIFSSKTIRSDNFSEVVKYLEEKFLKAKGVKQVAGNIKRLISGSFEFDIQFKTFPLKVKRKSKIFPVICHTDFNFGCPGVNEFLNIGFEKTIQDKNEFDIKPLTVIGLSVLFDISREGGDFNTLSKLIERYWKIINRRLDIRKRAMNADNYLRSVASFDELYYTLFKQSQ